MSRDQVNPTAPADRSRRRQRMLALGSIALMSFAILAAVPSSAHIDKPAKTGDHSLTTVIPPGPLHLQCWQYGTKIIDERPLDDLRQSSIGVSQWLRFRRDGGEVVLTSNGEMSCLVTQDRIGRP